MSTKARKGFACPKCGKPLRVRKTKRLAGGVVRRLRKCGACKHRVWTREHTEGAGY